MKQARKWERRHRKAMIELQAEAARAQVAETELDLARDVVAAARLAHRGCPDCKACDAIVEAIERYDTEKP